MNVPIESDKCLFTNLYGNEIWLYVHWLCNISLIIGQNIFIIAFSDIWLAKLVSSNSLGRD